MGKLLLTYAAIYFSLDFFKDYTFESLFSSRNYLIDKLKRTTFLAGSITLLLMVWL